MKEKALYAIQIMAYIPNIEKISGDIFDAIYKKINMLTIEFIICTARFIKLVRIF
jgi:hypothetical protein